MKQVQGKLTDVFTARRKDIIDAVFNHVAAQPDQRITISKPTRIYRVDENLCVELEEIREVYIRDGLRVVGRYMEAPCDVYGDDVDMDADEFDVDTFDMDIECMSLDEIYHVIVDLDEANTTK